MPHYHTEHNAVFTMRRVCYLTNVVEQDHSAVKWITRLMLGFKLFEVAQCTLAGIELMHMLRQG